MFYKTPTPLKSYSPSPDFQKQQMFTADPISTFINPPVQELPFQIFFNGNSGPANITPQPPDATFHRNVKFL